jgi:hypothetical protein
LGFGQEERCALEIFVDDVFDGTVVTAELAREEGDGVLLESIRQDAEGLALAKGDPIDKVGILIGDHENNRAGKTTGFGVADLDEISEIMKGLEKGADNDRRGVPNTRGTVGRSIDD